MRTYPEARSRRRFPLIRLLLLLVLVALAVWLAPRALDRTPPVLSVQNIESEGHYGQQVELVLVAEDTGRGLGRARIEVDGSHLTMLELAGEQAQVTYVWDTTSLADGEHELQFALSDASLWRNTTRRAFEVFVDNTPPEIQLAWRPKQIKQGQTLGLFIEADETLGGAEAEFLGRTIAFYPHAAGMRGLVGIPHDAQATVQPISLRAEDLAGNLSDLRTSIPIRGNNFRTGVVNLPRTKRSLLTDQEKKRQNREKRAQALQANHGEQLWEGRFRKPAAGVTTSPFGARRVYNNGVVRSVHLGWDIADPKGPPVMAANGGIVVLAEELPIHGNNVIVDHGEGVLSGYAHLAEILVTPGERVRKGQPIGVMGTTGQSTGVHLHWDMFVQGVPVDPEQWLTADFD